MKKLLAIIGVSIFALSACGGSSTPATTKSDAATTENFVNFYTEYGCALAANDGKIPEAEETAISSKYGLSNDDDLGKIVNSENKADVIARIIPKIEAKCLDAFTKSGVDPKGFVDASFEQY
jgi:hypothetical protein